MIYDEPLSETIGIKVTAKQKSFILANLGTSDLREILIEYANNYNAGQLRINYQGSANQWDVKNEPH